MLLLLILLRINENVGSLPNIFLLVSPDYHYHGEKVEVEEEAELEAHDDTLTRRREGKAVLSPEHVTQTAAVVRCQSD